MSKNILFMSYNGESLPIAMRLRADGGVAKVYVHRPECSGMYKGTDIRIDANSLQREITRADLIVFDCNMPYQDTAQDRRIAQMFSLTGGRTLFGELADAVRDDISCMGATRKAFDLTYKSQEKEDSPGAVNITSEGWFDGSKFVFFNYIIKDNNFLNGNLGLDVGTQGTIAWAAKKTVVDPVFSKLEECLFKDGYIGPVSLDLLLSRSEDPKILACKCGFSFDSVFGVFSILRGPLGNFFINDFSCGIGQEYAATQRLSLPPYPYADEGLLDMARGANIGSQVNGFWAQDIFCDKDGYLKCSGTDGIIGVMSAKGHTIGKAVAALYSKIGRMQPDERVQYRTDGGRRAEVSIKKLGSWGIDIRGS